MTDARKAALVRAGRVIAAGALASAISALPVLFTDAVPAEYALVAVPVLTAALAGLDKLRRYVEG